MDHDTSPGADPPGGGQNVPKDEWGSQPGNENSGGGQDGPKDEWGTQAINENSGGGQNGPKGEWGSTAPLEDDEVSDQASYISDYEDDNQPALPESNKIFQINMFLMGGLNVDAKHQYMYQDEHVTLQMALNSVENLRSTLIIQARFLQGIINGQSKFFNIQGEFLNTALQDLKVERLSLADGAERPTHLPSWICTCDTEGGRSLCQLTNLWSRNGSTSYSFNLVCVSFKSSCCILRGTDVVPPLMTNPVTQTAKNWVSAFTDGQSHHYRLVLRLTKYNTTFIDEVQAFKEQADRDREYDPLYKWIRNSDEKHQLLHGNIFNPGQRPLTSLQPPKDRFPDRLAYRNTFVYGATAEQDFQTVLKNDWEIHSFESVFAYLPGAKNTYLNFVRFDNKVNLERMKDDVRFILHLGIDPPNPRPVYERPAQDMDTLESTAQKVSSLREQINLLDSQPNISEGSKELYRLSKDLAAFDNEFKLYPAGLSDINWLCGVLREEDHWFHTLFNPPMKPLQILRHYLHELEGYMEFRNAFAISNTNPTNFEEEVACFTDFRTLYDQQKAEEEQARLDAERIASAQEIEPPADTEDISEFTNAKKINAPAPIKQKKEVDRRDWNAWPKASSTHMIPPGWALFFTQKPREPDWYGPKELHPFIDYDPPAINICFDDKEALSAALEAATKVTVQVRQIKDKQQWKDQVRMINTLTTNIDPDTEDLCNYLLNPGSSGKSVDFKRRINNSPYDPTSQFYTSQLKAWNSLDAVQQRILLMSSAPGVGKTFLITRLALTFLLALPLPDENDNSSTRPNKVIITSASNLAVDDTAQKLSDLVAENQELITKHRSKKIILIRVHSLPGEKKYFKKRYTSEKPTGYAVDENAADELATTFRMAKFARDMQQQHNAKHKQGDQRRVLLNLTLSEAMVDFLEENHHKNHNYTTLMQYLDEESSTLDPEKKAERNSIIVQLLHDTLKNADIVTCTTSLAANTILSTYFDPTLVINDEAAKSTEVTTLGAMIPYHPHIYILLGDPKQMYPTVKSLNALKSRDSDTSLLNPFAPQLKVSLFFRLLRCGHPVSELVEGLRCAGGGYRFVNEVIYDNKIVDMTYEFSADRKNKWIPERAKVARDFVKRNMNLQSPDAMVVNKVLINVQDSQDERVGHSLTSKDQLEEGYDLIQKILDDPTMKKKKILPLSPYQATVDEFNSYRKTCSWDMERVKEARTSDGSQGHEEDVVIIFLARARGIGFIGQASRLTVQETRARDIEFLIADEEGMFYGKDKDALLNRSNAKYLVMLFDHIHKYGGVVNVKAKSVFCENCETAEHRTKDCPKCSNCLEEGHIAKDCNWCKNCEQTGHSTRHCEACRLCKQMGHKRADCPNCQNCGQGGHASHQCPNPKPPHMFWCPRCRTKEHDGSACPNQRCKACNLPGHKTNQCPLETKPCDTCGEFGHLAKDCTTIKDSIWFSNKMSVSYRAEEKERQEEYIRQQKEQYLNDHPEIAHLLRGGDGGNGGGGSGSD